MDYEAIAEQDRKNRAECVALVTRPRVEAMVAAKWWTNTLRTDEPPDTGDSHNDGVMFALSERKNFSEMELMSFEAELAAGIEAKISEHEGRHSLGGADPCIKWRWYVSLHCDYHSDVLLAEAAERSGLEGSDMTTFPCKTSMEINRGKIVVSRGYAARRSVAWASVKGSEYWASISMIQCRDTLADLGHGVAGTDKSRAADLFAQAVALDIARPSGYDGELSDDATGGQRNLGEFITGLGMGMELAVAVRVAQMRKAPEAEAPGDEEGVPEKALEVQSGTASSIDGDAATEVKDFLKKYPDAYVPEEGA